MHPEQKPLFWRFLLNTAARDLGGVLTLAAVAIALAIYARGHCGSPSASTVGVAHPLISVKEIHALSQAAHTTILDARLLADYQRGHIPGALSLSAARFDTEFPKLEARLSSQKADLVVVYCSDMWCGLGDELQTKLIDRGFQHVGTFRDGWEGWQAAGLPEESAP